MGDKMEVQQQDGSPSRWKVMVDPKGSQGPEGNVM